MCFLALLRGLVPFTAAHLPFPQHRVLAADDTSVTPGSPHAGICGELSRVAGMESGDFPPGSTSGSKVRVTSYWVIAVHCPQGQLLLLGSYPDTSQSGKTGDSGD